MRRRSRPKRLTLWTAPVPEAILGLAVLALASVFVVATLRDRPKPCTAAAAVDAQATDHESAHACHASHLEGPDSDKQP